MPGPAPKHQSARARVNKTSTRATLTEPDPDEIQIPELPPVRYVDRKIDGEVVTLEVQWHQETLDWWRDVFSSPMAGEFHSSDRHGLFRLAVLIDEFWAKPSTQANAEIRLAQKDYGLTPLDRRRLEWTIASAEKATDDGRKRRGATESVQPREEDGGPDPRLHIVS